MSDKHHLIRRNGVYYYSRRVPDRAIKLFGRRLIRYSLKTTDKKRATSLREVHDLTWSARFAEVKRSPAATPNDAAIQRLQLRQPLSPALAARVVQDYVAQMDAQSERRLAVDPPDTVDEKQEIETEALMTISVLNKPGDPQGIELLSRACERIEHNAGIAHDGSERTSPEFVELVRRALLELEHRKLARLRGEHGAGYFDAFFGEVPKLLSPLERSLSSS